MLSPTSMAYWQAASSSVDVCWWGELSCPDRQSHWSTHWPTKLPSGTHCLNCHSRCLRCNLCFAKGMGCQAETFGRGSDPSGDHNCSTWHSSTYFSCCLTWWDRDFAECLNGYVCYSLHLHWWLGAVWMVYYPASISCWFDYSQDWFARMASYLVMNFTHTDFCLTYSVSGSGCFTLIENYFGKCDSS